MRRVGILVAGCLALTGAASASTLDCPQVRLIVPYPAGGATDVAARLVGERLDAVLKKPFVVENRSGASGNIGTQAVIASPPDGCTLLVNAAVMATFPASFSKLGYDPINDLAPIGGIGITPTLLVTASSSSATDIKSLVTWGKTKPTGIDYATAGYGLLQHLAVEEIKRRTGGEFVHVVYKGGSQALADLMTARLDLGSFAAGSVVPLVKEGRLKALGVVAKKRTAIAPDVPTTAEQGFEDLDAGVHFMLYAPAKTPKATVALLSEALRTVVGDPALKDRFANIGFDPTPISSDEAAKIMRDTAESWIPVINRLSIKLN